VEVELISITDKPIDVAKLLNYVSDDGSGASVLFTGTVRDHNEQDKVTKIHYEAYQEMEKETLQKFMVHAFVIIHTKSGEQGNIMRKLAEIPTVIEADMVIGSNELICKVVAPTYNDISDIITKKIRRLDNIQSTLTLNIIDKITS